MSLYLRDTPSLTLRELADALHTDTRQWGGVTTEMRVRRDEQTQSLSVAFGNEEVPATNDGVEQLATLLGIPRNFLLEAPAHVKEFLLNEYLRTNVANASVYFTDSGISEVVRPERLRIEPKALVEAAIKVVDETALVDSWHCDPDEFLADIVVPDGFDRGIGGDPAVNDITRGGIRIGQNRKNHHAPWVSTFLYRLICTNGMEVPETGLRIDARKNTVEGVLAELELAAQHAFSQVEQQVAHFYELRNQRIGADRTQAVIRIARERGLPDRTVNALALRVPDQLDPEVIGHEPSVFDVVNLITNQANHPEIRGRRGPRRQLQVAGGAIVRTESERCGTCQQSLN